MGLKSILTISHTQHKPKKIKKYFLGTALEVVSKLDWFEVETLLLTIFVWPPPVETSTDFLVGWTGGGGGTKVG